MIVEPSGNGYHAIWRGPSGRVYCGFSTARQEAIQFCLQLVFKESLYFPVRATETATDCQGARSGSFEEAAQ